MATNPLHFIRKHSDRIRDLVGFGFFLFATLISGLAAWQHPSILAWLFAIHNGLLAFFYTRRTPAKQYDRTGLWLGMIAAFLPTFTTSSHSEWYLLIPALAGYSLILCSHHFRITFWGCSCGSWPDQSWSLSVITSPDVSRRTGVQGNDGFQFSRLVHCHSFICCSDVHSMLANPSRRKND